jgi:hypothetical protein
MLLSRHGVAVPAIAWTTVENALHAWIVAATGLAATSVTGNGGPRPPMPYIVMQLAGPRPIGHDWRVYDDAPDPQPGAELRVRAQGHRMARLQLQCFAGEDSGNEAVRVLSDAISALSLHVHDLDVAGIGIGDVAPIQLIEGRRGGILDPRAVCEIELHLGSEVEGRETYIERLQLVATEHTTGHTEELWPLPGD